VTRALAASLPRSVDIVATDLNRPMLDFAASKSGMERLLFQQADALALPFPDGSFDVVVCQFGIMFFPDRVAGMREARRVLKPGGRFLFSVWGSLSDNPVMAVTVESLARRYPGHPARFLERTPCGYHGREVIGGDLRAAGFGASTIETIRLTGRAPDARSPAMGLCQGTPLRAEIEAEEPGGLQAATGAAASAICQTALRSPVTGARYRPALPWRGAIEEILAARSFSSRPGGSRLWSLGLAAVCRHQVA
jgi:SAM-dependent methyltransferase